MALIIKNLVLRIVQNFLEILKTGKDEERSLLENRKNTASQR